MKYNPLLHIIESLDDMEQFLHLSQQVEKHLYCRFQKEQLQHRHLVQLQERKIKSVSFEDAHTIYPYHPLTHLSETKQ